MFLGCGSRGFGWEVGGKERCFFGGGELDVTLPESNISPENRGPLEFRRFLLESIIFRGDVSFRDLEFVFFL